jgi:hypothetical protein
MAFSPAAHADNWFSKLFKKHTEPAARPVAPTYTPPPRTFSKVIRIPVSLGANDNCDQLAAALSEQIGQQGPSGISLELDQPTCDVQTVTYEKTNYRIGTVQISYHYTTTLWAPYAPDFNVDILGGRPTFMSKSDGSSGVFPTYQSCLDAGASITQGFATQTGAAPLAIFCKANSFGLDYQNTQDSTKMYQPDRNYSLEIYSVGPQSQHLYVYQNMNGASPDVANRIPEMKTTYSLLTGANYTVVYPADPSQIGADPTHVEGTYIAYYAQNPAGVNQWPAGHPANAQECRDQSVNAVRIWDELGAPNAQPICEPYYGDAQTLVMIELGGKLVIEAPGNADLTFTGANAYANCMSTNEQELIDSSRGNSYERGALCLPIDESHPEQGYTAQLFMQ